MSEVNEILKKVSASIEEATGKFNAKAEEALKEAQKTGKLSAETKESRSFIWQAPLKGVGLYRCDAYRPSAPGGGIFSLTATFTQAFAP